MNTPAKQDHGPPPATASRYALCFPTHPTHPNWPQFWQALANEAQRIDREGPCQMPIYYDVDQSTFANNESYVKLLEETRAHRVAGMIFATDPWLVDTTPLFTENNVPMVAIMHPPHPERYTTLSYICLDTPGLYDKAIEYFSKRKRKRLAVLTVSDEFSKSFESVKEEAARCGMEIRPQWIQTVQNISPHPARELMRRLLVKDHPDAILITDDNLLEEASEGILDSGMQVGRELDVIAHCNYPWLTGGAVLARRIGFDVQQILAECMKTIDGRHHGQRTVPVWIPAIFEDDMGAIQID